MLESKTVKVEGIDVHYWAGGTGFPLLMLHGVGPGTSIQGNFGPVLEPLAARCRIVAVDLIGFGASAIGSLPQGYVQNAATGDLWRDAISRGDLAVSRGVALSQDDHLRRAVIERLMCDFQVDLGAVAQAHGRDATEFAAELQSLARFRDDGLIEIDRDRIELRVPARPFVRTVCAVFDRYLKAEETQHARAV